MWSMTTTTCSFDLRGSMVARGRGDNLLSPKAQPKPVRETSNNRLISDLRAIFVWPTRGEGSASVAIRDQASLSQWLQRGYNLRCRRRRLE